MGRRARFCRVPILSGASIAGEPLTSQPLDSHSPRKTKMPVYDCVISTTHLRGRTKGGAGRRVHLRGTDSAARRRLLDLCHPAQLLLNPVVPFVFAIVAHIQPDMGQAGELRLSVFRREQQCHPIVIPHVRGMHCRCEYPALGTHEYVTFAPLIFLAPS
jgi:hypothetical protein